MLESGQTIFDCQIVKSLSENSTYHSYLVNCFDSTAAKLLLLHSDPPFEQKNRQYFLDQADWLAGQTFPGIGIPIRAGEIGDELACLYPLPPGIPLRQILNSGLSMRQSLELTKRIAERLSIPHSTDLQHGNLSPETIYLDNNSPYLADFSLNQLVNLDYQSGVDPHYTSPEQVRGEAPGTASDIYSLGCVLYHLLIGRTPFSGDDPFAIATQHLSGEFPELSKELNACQPLLTAMTSINANERLTVNALLAQISQLLADEEVDRQPASPLADDKLNDDSELEADLSLFDPVADDAEMAARIEARLKEHSVVFQESFAEDSLESSTPDATEGLDQAYPEEKSRTGRYILLLLLGVLIGSGSYFLFFDQEIPVIPALEQQANIVSTPDLDRGVRMWESSDLAAAETEFKNVIEAFPGDPRAYNNLAALYASEGNYDRSRDYLEQALEIDETYATVYRNLGSVYAEMARDSYGRALQLDETESLLSLQVFSGQGVIYLDPIYEDIATVAMEDQTTEIVTPQPELVNVEQPIVGAEIIPPFQPIDDKAIKEVVSQLESEPDVVESPVAAAEMEQADQPIEEKPINGVVSQSEPEPVESPVAAVQIELTDNSIKNSPTIVAAVDPIDKLLVTVENESNSVKKVAKKTIEKKVGVPVEVSATEGTDAVTEHESAENFLKRWALAWSNQEIDDYLTFYGEQFIPPAGKKRAAWEAERQIRLLKPKTIKVSLEGFQLTPQENNRVQVETMQDYQSDIFADRTKKIFDLQQTENGWKILRERSLWSIR